VRNNSFALETERVYAPLVTYFRASLLSALTLGALFVAGCGHVNAQNPGTITLTPTTSTSLRWLNIGDPCVDSKGRFGHLREDPSSLTDLVIGCEIDDGKPPRWVDGPHQMTISHWECDKGYELDGFNVTWPGGMAKITPARCKAVVESQKETP